MNVKSEKGVTLIILIIMLIVMGIITTITLNNSPRQLQIGNVNNLFSDIDSLSSKISDYYLQNGTIPIMENNPYLENANELKTVLSSNGALPDEINPNDQGAYYVIDLSKLDNLTLNFGKDYKNWNDTSTYEEYQDIYIINPITHQIYYPASINLRGTVYYTRDVEANTIYPIQSSQVGNFAVSLVNSNNENLLEKETQYSVKKDGTISLTTNVAVQKNGNDDVKLQIIQYAWSKESSKDKESNVEFTKFELNENGTTTIKSRDLPAGTYYLWIKIIDNYGNNYYKISKANKIVQAE